MPYVDISANSKGQEALKDVVALALKLSVKNADVDKGYGVVSLLGMTLPYSRSQEYEADYIGLRIVAEAGYSPSAAIKFLEKINDIPEDKLEFEFFSTHDNCSFWLVGFFVYFP